MKSKTFYATLHNETEEKALLEFLREYFTDCSIVKTENSGEFLLQNMYGKHLPSNDVLGLGWYANGFLKGYRAGARKLF